MISLRLCWVFRRIGIIMSKRNYNPWWICITLFEYTGVEKSSPVQNNGSQIFQCSWKSLSANRSWTSGEWATARRLTFISSAREMLYYKPRWWIKDRSAAESLTVITIGRAFLAARSRVTYIIRDSAVSKLPERRFPNLRTYGTRGSKIILLWDGW